MAFDARLLKKVRSEFPTVEADPTGRRRSFLDNGAGTLVNERSLDREVLARVDWSANVGNDFTESKGAEQTIAEGRQAVADLLGAGKPNTIVSGESATSLLFGLSYAIGKELSGKENVVTTGYEHYTNVSPWVELGSNGLIEELRFAEFDRETGELDYDDLAGRIDEDTAVVTATAASNLLGSKTDLKRVGKMAKEVGAYFIVDAVHHVAHGPIDVKAIGCDALVFSGYKLFARHGSYMFMRPDLIEDLCPYKVYASPAHGPEKWEWGTRDQAMFAAITGAVDYLAWLGNPAAKLYPKAGEQRAKRIRAGLESVEAYEKSISELMLEGKGKVAGLNDIPGITIYGSKDPARVEGRDPTFAFKLKGWDDRALAKLLWDKYAIAVGAEDYFSRVPALFDAKTMVRATFVHYNTPDEAVALLKALNELATKKRR